MTDTTKIIKSDVQNKRVGTAIVAKQGDAKSRYVRVTMCRDGIEMPVPQSAEVIINAARPDGRSKAFFCTVNSDGTVTAPLTGWMLECAGVLKCSISVLGEGGEKLTSTTFFVDVEPAEFGGGAEEDKTLDVLAKLVVECRNAISEAGTAAGAASAAAGAASAAAGAANEAAKAANAVAAAKLDKSAVVQTTGQSADKVMSQGAVTEAIKAGDTQGVNLVLGSDVEYTNAEYLIHTYTLTEDFRLGETYTVTIWGKLGEGKDAFVPYLAGGFNNLGEMNTIADGVYKVTGSIHSWYQNSTFPKTVLRIYASPTSVAAASTITKIKLQYGAVESPIWTPAPEDIVTTMTNQQKLVRDIKNAIATGEANMTDVQLALAEIYEMLV